MDKIDSGPSSTQLPASKAQPAALVSATAVLNLGKDSSSNIMDMENPPKTRIPQALLSSFHKLLGSDEGKVAMKRIKVCCGVCKETRFYSLHRGITRIAGVISCELCRHFYQGFKRKPAKATCVSPIPGQCYTTNTWLEKKCKACWVMQIAENCPLDMNLYMELSQQLPIEMQLTMRGVPPQKTTLLPSKFGNLALEIYRDGSWIDVTDTTVIDQQLQLRNMSPDSDEDDTVISNNDENEDIPMEIQEGMDESSSTDTDDELVKNGAKLKQPKPIEPSLPHLPMVKSIKSISNNFNFGRSSIQDDPDDPDAMDGSDSSQGQGGVGGHSPQSSSPNLSRSTSPQTAIQQKALNKVPASTRNTRGIPRYEVVGTTENNFLDNFNPRNSQRVRRKKEQIDYFKKSSTNPVNRSTSRTVYDANGFIMANGKDLCDCLQPDCPGCHFPCPKCRSHKCGKECRVNRRWYYEKVEMEGTKFFWTNAFIKSF